MQCANPRHATHVIFFSPSLSRFYNGLVHLWPYACAETAICKNPATIVTMPESETPISEYSDDRKAFTAVFGNRYCQVANILTQERIVLGRSKLVVS